MTAMFERRTFAAALAFVLALSVQSPAVSGRQAPSAPDDVIADLVAANRILAMENVLDAMGHVSVRHPSRPDRFLLARSMPPELVTAADILELDLDANPVDKSGRASYLERFIHSEIYRARRDVNAIVHCHAPSLIPFADSDVPLRAMYHMAAFIADGVPVFDIRQAAGMTDLLVRDAKLGRALATSLGNKIAGYLGGFFDEGNTSLMVQLFGSMAVASIIAAGVLVALAPTLRRLMGRVR